MSKDLLEKALEASGKKDDIFGDSEQPKRSITYDEKGIFVRETIEGKEYNTDYTELHECMICKKERLIGSGTASCLICDKVMTLGEYEAYVTEYVEYFKSREFGKKETPIITLDKGYIAKIQTIIEETGLSQEAIVHGVREKIIELKGLISQDGALFIIAKDYGIDLESKEETIEDIFGDSKKEASKEGKSVVEGMLRDSGSMIVSTTITDSKTLEVFETENDKYFKDKPELKKAMDNENKEIAKRLGMKVPPPIPSKEEITKKQEDLNPNSEYPMQLTETYKDLPTITNPQYFSKEVISESVALMRFLIKSIIKPSDFQPIGNNKFLKRSGYNKIAQAFGITTKQIGEIEIYENINGIISAKARVKATLGEVKYQDGLKLLLEADKITTEEAIVMIAKLGKIREADGFGEVAMDEIKFGKNQTIHNLKGYAFTRARNRAIADLVGFGVVSAMEVNTNSDVDEIFGGK